MLSKLFACVLLMTGLAFGQLSVKTVDGSSTELIIGAAGKKYNSTLMTVPNTLTAVTTTTTKVQVIHCTNTTGSAATLTITDGTGTEYFTTVSIAANSVAVVQYGTVGLTYTNGIKVNSGTNGALKCQFEGAQ